MAQGKRRDWPPREKLSELIWEHHGVVAHIAAKVGCGGPVLERHLKREGMYDEVNAARAAAKRDGIPLAGPAVGRRERAVLSSDPAEWGDIRRLLKDRGLDLDDWIVTGARVNEWGDPTGVMNAQLRIDVLPRLGLLMPARLEKHRRKPPVASKTSRGLWAIISDPHYPFHDPRLHDGLCEWLREHTPEHGVMLGDTVDHNAFSRFVQWPGRTDDANPALQIACDRLQEIRDASPNTRWRIVKGNHDDDRLLKAILGSIPKLYNLTRAQLRDGPQEHPVHTLAHLLHYDTLGFEHNLTVGDYNDDEVIISQDPPIIGRHGYATKSGAGASVLATVQDMLANVWVGHVHRQAIVGHSKHDPITKALLRFYGVEVGTLADCTGNGLGHYIPSRRPDWQPGFAVGQQHNDGETVTPELVPWTKNTLYFRDWSCKP